MGTSRSKIDAPPASPLIPPWADQDPVPPPPEPDPESVDPSAAPSDEQPTAPPATPFSPEAAPRRYAGFRTSLRRYATSGDRRDARAALGHWARTSTGGPIAGSRRLARAARTGGAALAGIARAGGGLPPIAGALDVRTLAGLPAEEAVARIVDAFCPPGILDEEVARLSMGEALAAALASADTFDPTSIDANAVRVATLTFVAELVFVSVAGDAGQALAAAPSPAAAAEREADLRSLVREVTDVVGTPILAAAGSVLSPDAMAALVMQLVEVALAEMTTW